METKSAPHSPTPVIQPSSLFQGASPKLTFIFGLVTGIAATALVGALVILPKAYSSDSKKTAGTTTTTTTTPTPTDTAPQKFNDVKPVSDDDYIRGNKNAKLTLIEYSDYECPFCKSFHPTMLQVMDEYKDDIRWVYRHFPLSFHVNAPKQAEAALCIGKLDGAEKFWDFTDKIFERTAAGGTGFALTDLGPLAKEIGVDQTKFQTCLDSGEMAARVAAETADGTTGGVSGTPSTLLVDTATGKTIAGIPGAYPLAQVKTAIDDALKSL